jgi:hypothetical protein
VNQQKSNKAPKQLAANFPAAHRREPDTNQDTNEQSRQLIHHTLPRFPNPLKK